MYSARKLWAIALVLAAPALHAQEPVRTELTTVEQRPVSRSNIVVGELAPYQQVAIHAKVTGFVESVRVDRGSRVRAGDLLATMTAPELEARRAEAESRIPEIEARKVEAEAQLAAAQSTYGRLQEAAKTPGVVAGNDLVLAGKAVEAAQARIAAMDKSVEAVRAAVRSIQALEEYLQLKAPFDGVITDRYAHPGALAGPESDRSKPLFQLEQINRLRLVAAVPESLFGSVRNGTRVPFSVPAHPGATFTGTVARPSFAVDPATRTMPVELDVNNSSGRLTPGMYAEVQWPARRRGNTLFVPRTAIKATTERQFVIRVNNGAAEWVDVKRGVIEDQMIEVIGNLNAGDRIVLRATDEIRPGTRVEARAGQ